MKNILISGVGGQGSLLASRIIGSLYLSRGYDVKISEIHGMSQRGGSVITYVRAGEKIASPLIPLGECDILIAFEQLEAARYLQYMRSGGVIAMSTQEVLPMPVISGAVKYPKNLPEAIKDLNVETLVVDAIKLAFEAGSPRTANIVMLGSVSRKMEFDEDSWKQAMKENIKPNFLDVNLKAFELGRNAV